MFLKNLETVAGQCFILPKEPFLLHSFSKFDRPESEIGVLRKIISLFSAHISYVTGNKFSLQNQLSHVALELPIFCQQRTVGFKNQLQSLSRILNFINGPLTPGCNSTEARYDKLATFSPRNSARL